MSYAQSIDGLNIEVTTGKVAQSIDSLDMLLSTSEGAVQDGIVLISPANGEINVSVTPSFDWDSSTAYDAYKILIDADETFSSPIEAYVTASDFAQTIALLSATGYFWKVIGGDVTDRPAIVPAVGSGIGEGSRALDEQALNDLWAATQGAEIPPERYLQSESELPEITSTSNARERIHNQEFYIINGDIYKVNDGPLVWLNVGPIWKDSTGWNNGDVSLQLSNYDTIAGVKVEELTINGVTELRVTGIDFQKLNYTSNENVTAGNNLVGTLPPTMGNLRQLRDRLNLKQNLLYGDIPHSMYTYPYLERWSLAGQAAEIDMSRRSEWYEPPHARDYGAEPHSLLGGGGKRYQHSNRLGGIIPPTVNQMQSLKLFECRQQRLRGKIPQELLQIPSLQGIFLNNQRGSASTAIPENERELGGMLPDDWSQMVNLNYLNLDKIESNRDWQISDAGFNSLNSLPKIFNMFIRRILGEFPTFPNVTDLRYHNYGKQGAVQSIPFPIDLFRPETRRLSKFAGTNRGFSGTIPEKTLPTNEDDRLLMNAFSVGYNGLTGTIPQWIKDLKGVIILSLEGNEFTGEAPWELQRTISRLFKVHNNNFSGQVKARPYSIADFEATVTEVIAPNQLRLSFDTTPLASGTITESTTGWIRIDGASHQNEWSDVTQTRIIVPDGEDLVWTTELYAIDNTEYVWAPDGPDVSGTEGLEYEITTIYTNKVVGFEDPNAVGFDDRARFILSNTNDVFTFDRDVTATVGEVVRLYGRSDILFSYLQSNNLYGKIPEAHAYSPTDRTGADFLYDNNDFGWNANKQLIDFHVPDFTNLGKYRGGECARLNISQNRLIPYHILPNHTANQTINSYSFGNQKRFSDIQSFSYDQIGETLEIDVFQLSGLIHPNDTLVWEKDGEVFSTASSNISINQLSIEFQSLRVEDSGTYRLRITNTDLPGLTFYSGDITITVTDFDLNP